MTAEQLIRLFQGYLAARDGYILDAISITGARVVYYLVTQPSIISRPQRYTHCLALTTSRPVSVEYTVDTKMYIDNKNVQIIFSVTGS